MLKFILAKILIKNVKYADQTKIKGSMGSSPDGIFFFI